MKDTSIFNYIKGIASVIAEKRGADLKLIEDWKLILPKEYADHTTPIKISWNKDNQGILYVGVENHILEKILIYQNEQIIDRLNTYFGYKCITKIKFLRQ